VRVIVDGFACTSGQIETQDAVSPSQADTGYIEARGHLSQVYDLGGGAGLADQLGEGAFGRVCAAMQVSKSPRTCALKFVPKASDAAADTYQSHHVGAGLHQQLLRMSMHQPHPSIVEYLDFLESAEHYFVVMEQLRGPDLLTALADEDLTESLVRRVMQQLLGALHHLHDVVGLYHRDIKFENVLLRQGMDVFATELVLVDFGLARRVDQDWDNKLSGTVMYIAPEVVHARVQKRVQGGFLRQNSMGGFSTAVDLWSAGVVMYCLATGRAFMSDEDVMNLQGSDEKLIRRMVEEAPRWAWDLLGELLQPHPAHRATAGQALDHRWLNPGANLGAALAVFASPKGCEVRSALKAAGAAKPVVRASVPSVPLEQLHQDGSCRTLAPSAVGPASFRMSPAVRQQSKNSMVISSVCDGVVRRASLRYVKEQYQPAISSTVQDAIKVGLGGIGL
jgi:serine/threonine protein kinase